MLKNKNNKKEKNDNAITINLNDSYCSQLLKIADAYNMTVAATGRYLLQKALIGEYATIQASNDNTTEIKQAIYKKLIAIASNTSGFK